MSTAVAVHNGSPLGSRDSDRHSIHSSSRSPRNSHLRSSAEYTRLAPSSAPSKPPQERPMEPGNTQEEERRRFQLAAPSRQSESTVAVTEESSSAGAVPQIKREQPASPPPPSSTASKHRPRRLDLSGSNATNSRGPPSGALTSKDSLATMQDIGIACLSPGFQTSNPDMQQKVARSMELQKQQRQLIEARKRGETHSERANSSAATFAKAPATARRKGPPPGLMITAHPASHFSGEPRVVQSAPLNQSFTGLRGGPSHVHPLSRQVLDRSQTQANATHPQQSPSQSSNRLPPILDVLGNDGYRGGGSPRNNGSLLPPPPARPHSPTHSRPLPSPGLPQPPHSAGLHPPSSMLHVQPQGPSPPNQRHREYKSAEDAVRGLSGGRDDLIPRLVHYGGHQPPTPPSPLGGGPRDAHHQGSSHVGRSDANPRRRPRDEFERDFNGSEMDEHRREFHDERARRILGPLPVRHESPGTQQRKKSEFLDLMSRAWDLMHS